MKPLCLDLYAGLGGWAEGLMAAGWEVLGFDNNPRFIGRYPGNLVIHDVMNLCCRKMRGRVQLVVASPDCREPSYRAMPWSRAKKLNAEGPPHKFIAMFSRCFEIADEIGCPVIVENVVGAQRWVGRAAWRYGSFYFWGYVPGLIPIAAGDGVKRRDADGYSRTHPAAFGWKAPRSSSRSAARREASAQIAKIPFDLAKWIGEVYHP